MNKILKSIWNSKHGNYVFFLTFVSLVGIYLYFDRPRASTISDLTEIRGTLNQIEKVLVYSKKINKTERDSTYHIYLNEYPSKFQVSYFPFDRQQFYKSAQFNDQIILHIAKENVNRLNDFDAKIRSFSLTVNNKVYVSKNSGLMGFGKGYFELGMIFLPLAINFFLINKILRVK